MPHVKICGITRARDAEAAAAAGAHAIGFNFWREGKRYIDPERARRIAARLPASVLRVGVFVDAPRPDMIAIRDIVGLDIVQLHGNESPDALEDMPCAVWKAFRGCVEYAEIRRFAAADAFLLDGAAEGAFGGTGRLADLETAGRLAEIGTLVLAGGLSAENVAERARLCRPAMVDVASGVELSTGIKDSRKIRSFIAAAARA